MTTDQPKKPTDGRIKAPLEKPVQKVLEPFVDFVRAQSSAGFILLGAAALAIVLASSDASAAYEWLKHLTIEIRVGDFTYGKTFVHWVNEGLMAVYFFLLGLEIKRELLAGQLAETRLAVMVIAAAIGGMILPALCYLLVSGATEYAGGWGIPVATDTAFALAVLVMLRRHVPTIVRAFLVGLAIVDDLGAIGIVALAYTEHLNTGFLFATAGLLLTCAVCNLMGLRHPLGYTVLGFGVWITVMQSGIHGTIAGVLMAVLAPVRPVVKQHKFVELVNKKIKRFNAGRTPGDRPRTAMLERDQQQSTAEEIRDAAVMVTAPLRRWERALDDPVTLIVLPLFAFLNAGLHLNVASLGAIVSHPVMWGIAFGLLVGKPVGVFLGTFVAVRLGICDLPKSMSFGHVAGVGLLAGIGFTMSVFISGLAFDEESSEMAAAKAGILVSSVIAAIAAMLWLRIWSNRHSNLQHK